MKGVLIIGILFLMFVASVSGADYYIDSNSGDDSFDGLTPEKSWKTLGKASSTTFNNGDIILLKKGSQWWEQLTLKKPLGGQKRLTITTYGNGNKPIINGNMGIPNLWVPYEGTYEGQSLDLGPNIYVTPLDWRSGIKQVYVDGQRVDISKEPNNGYYNIDEAHQDYIISNDLLTNGFSYNGSNIYLRVETWHMDKRHVDDYDFATGTTKFSPNVSSYYTLKPDYGFFYSNHPSFIDQDYEWAIGMDNNLYMRIPNDPSSHSYAGSFFDYGISAQWNYEGELIIEGIQIKNSADTGIYVNTDVFEIDGSIILNSNNGGIFPLSNDVKIISNEIYNSNLRGITISNSDNVVIYDNIIRDSGSFSTSDDVGQGLSGISLYGADKVNISNNIIENSGYAGMTISGASTSIDDLTIKNNHISGFSLLLNDGGGIYINGQKIDLTNSDISNNIIHGGHGNTDGTPYPEWNIANGIYLDWYASNVIITNNTIYDIKTVAGGIKINGGDNNIIKENTIFYNHILGSPISIRNMEITPLTGNIIEKNIFYNDNINLGVYLFNVRSDFTENPGDPRDFFGSFSNNRNFNPKNPKMIVYYGGAPGQFNSNFSINSLEDFNLKGTNPRFEVNPTDQVMNINIDQEYCDVNGLIVGDSISLLPFSSKILLECSCNYNSICESGETCIQDNCCNGNTYNPLTQICCFGSIYSGTCCSNSDCTSPNICNLANHQCETFSTCSLADTTGDSIVSIGELLTYISSWKSGGVSIGELLTAISEWKSGCS